MTETPTCEHIPPAGQAGPLPRLPAGTGPPACVLLAQHCGPRPLPEESSLPCSQVAMAHWGQPDPQVPATGHVTGKAGMNLGNDGLTWSSGGGGHQAHAPNVSPLPRQPHRSPAGHEPAWTLQVGCRDTAPTEAAMLVMHRALASWRKCLLPSKHCVCHQSN